jgi:CRISPR-associated protein Cas1
MKNYYVLSYGRVKRENNSLVIENSDGEKKPVPVEDVDSLYVYGEVDLNTRLLNFLTTKRIPLHIFNYYGYYAGSYYPREYLHSGYMLVQQVAHYSNTGDRMVLARELVRAAAHSMLRNIAYYANRKDGGAALPGDGDGEPVGEISPDAPIGAMPPTDEQEEAMVDAVIDAPASTETTGEPDPFMSSVAFDDEPQSLRYLQSSIVRLAGEIDGKSRIDDLMGIEGKMREQYYQAWRHILREGWAFERRVRRPPDNEVNALISFGNSVVYTACLSEIYRTQLAPTISYLHEPGVRRFSLALDLSEIFKPLVVDRAIFRLINTAQLTAKHFDNSMDGCYLTEAGKRIFLQALEERMSATIKHRRLGRHVSYRHLIRLECYKLIRHLTGVEAYRAFRAWW